ALAAALSGDREHPRPVLALDSRGRGKSDYDRKPANYNLQVELGDVLSVLTALDIGQAAFVGTSRGGILTMLLAVARPAAIAGGAPGRARRVRDKRHGRGERPRGRGGEQELWRKPAPPPTLPRRCRRPATAVRQLLSQMERRRLARLRAGNIQRGRRATRSRL